MKRAFILINLLLIFLIANSGVSGFYVYIAGKLKSEESLSSAQTRQRTPEHKTSHPQSYYAHVTRRDLFKTDFIKPKPAKKIKAPPKEVKITKLNLELKGTITGTGSDPLAVISKKGRSGQMLYAVGDTIDQATIKAIMKGKVILLVNGREEVLLMKEPKTGAAYLAKPAPIVSTQEAVNIKDGFVKKVALTWDDVNALKERMGELRKKVRIRPHFFKGKLDGFRITNIKKDSVFYKKLGLRNGDIISGVNDKDLRSLQDAAGIYREFNLMAGNTIDSNVKIKRMGKSGQIHYSIQ